MSQVIREVRQGFDVLGLRDEHAEVRIIPELGAKVSSLVSLPCGREWMWSPPGTRLFRNRTGDPFPDGTCIGADECLPTLAPCRWRGRELPDHGEAWAESWELDESALAESLVRVRLRLPVSPFEIERTVSLRDGVISLDYVLRNLGSEPEEYVWAFHPLMAMRTGDHLLLPPEVKSLRVEAAMEADFGPRGTALGWPRPGPGIGLDRFELGRRAALKLFTDPLTQPLAAVRNSISGDYLVFQIAHGVTDAFGIWINRGAWQHSDIIAIEPTNGAPDALHLAVEDWRRFVRLAAGEQVRWGLMLHLGTDAQTPADVFLDRFV